MHEWWRHGANTRGPRRAPLRVFESMVIHQMDPRAPSLDTPRGVQRGHPRGVQTQDDHLEMAISGVSSRPWVKFHGMKSQQ